jgi:hypothetical protein
VLTPLPAKDSEKNMRLFKRFALAGLLACTAAAGAAQAPQAAAPSPARWHVDGATDRCVLTRRLEGTPVAATFILRTIPGSGRYDVILAAPDLSADVRRPGRPALLTLTPGGRAHQRVGARIRLPEALGEGIAFGPLDPAFAVEFARASTLELADQQSRALGRWTIPVAARAAEALAYCEAEKQVEWGADPASVEAGATPPQPANDASEWLSARDLGLVGSLASATFSAVFQLVVDAEGKPTECRLLESAGDVDLSRACRTLIARARYVPAKDAHGNAVRSVAVHLLDYRFDVDIQIR